MRVTCIAALVLGACVGGCAKPAATVSSPALLGEPATALVQAVPALAPPAGTAGPIPKAVPMAVSAGTLYDTFAYNEAKGELEYNQGQVLDVTLTVNMVRKDQRGFHVTVLAFESSSTAPACLYCYAKAGEEAAFADLKLSDRVVLRGSGIAKIGKFNIAGNLYPILALGECSLLRKVPAAKPGPPVD